MAGLVVHLNDAELVTVGTADLDLLDVHVSGDLIGPEPAVLRVSGGSYPEGQASQYLIWEDERNLTFGDTISVSFLKDAETSRPGQTIEQLYPEETQESPASFTPVETVVKELSQKPKCFSALSFRLLFPDRIDISGSTKPQDHGFAFSVVWTADRPEHARMSMHTYSLQNLLEHTNGTYHADTRLRHGQRASFTVVPNSSIWTPSEK